MKEMEVKGEKRRIPTKRKEKKIEGGKKDRSKSCLREREEKNKGTGRKRQ